MTEEKSVVIRSDNPEKDKVLFGFKDYALTLAEIIATKRNETPLVIGVYGPWGSGKTTLMREVISQLAGESFKNKSLYRKCKPVWFHAWKYANENEILAALIEEIFRTMSRDGFFKAYAGLEKLITNFKLSKALGKLTELKTGIDVSEIFSDPVYREKIGFYDTFRDFFNRLVWQYLNWKPQVTRSRKPDDTKAALVIFIDDLDRCPPGRILQVLETIKLFMDKKGCIFVIGAARDIIEKSLKDRYREDAGKFMEKILQITFTLPQISDDDFIEYLKSMDKEIKDDVEPYLDHILPAMQKNPRKVKRFLNNLYLQRRLVENRGLKIDFEILLFLNIMDFIYPYLKKEIADNPEILYLLKEKIEELEKSTAGSKLWEISPDILKTVPQSLHKYVQRKDLVEILKKFDCGREQLDQILTFKAVFSEPAAVEKPKRELQPKIFENMVEIAQGEFLFGEKPEPAEIEKSFLIDIYPVTNARFEEFIKAGGYTEKDYWSEPGQQWLEENKRSFPAYWEDPKWNQPDLPLVGVSWYEADAFARWSGGRLPTEKEWERAARGIDGRQYPWGDEFDKEKCNTVESGLKSTSRVDRYPNGTSLEGCYDMAGNVWEWTADWLGEKEEAKVLKGGSWSGLRVYARCSERGGDFPGGRLSDVGFRCARDPKK